MGNYGRAIFSEYSYDDKGRLIMALQFEGDRSDTLTVLKIKYEGDKMTLINGEAGFNEYIKDTTVYTLTNGRATSAYSYRNGGAYHSSFAHNIVYEYNADNMLAKVTTTNAFAGAGPVGKVLSVVEYTYKDGNLISAKDTRGENMQYSSQDVFEYYTDKPAVKFDLFSSLYGFEGDIIQPGSKNLVKKYTSMFSDPSVDPIIINFEYSNDAEGKVNKYILKGDGGEKVEVSLEYKCR